jgi:hypothetical protein
MISINSLSGGRSSSFMAMHYPADHEIFSLVTIEDINCSPKDIGLIKKVSDKIGKQFIASAESDLTIIAMLDLEQLIGREIIWVSGLTFEKVNKKATGGKGLPNQQWRFCTTEMKMRPIWDWWYKNINQKVKMGIGFRYDEMERADRLSTTFKGVVGTRKTRKKWEEIEWRVGYFPLIDNKILHIHVKNWADKSGIVFPSDSNCVGCFHKSVQQLRKNFEDEPNKMQWFADQEINARWKKKMKYEQIKSLGLQQDFFFGEGSGCQAGYCTD